MPASRRSAHTAHPASHAGGGTRKGFHPNGDRFVSLLALTSLLVMSLPAGPGLAYPAPSRTEVLVPGVGASKAGAVASPDGRYIAYAGLDHLPGDDNGVHDIHILDRTTGVAELVSVATDGDLANGESSSLGLSDDGRYVVFCSAASNLVPGDTTTGGCDSPVPGTFGPPLGGDIFVRDRVAGTTERVSVTTGGTQANAPSNHPSISADGRYLAFSSRASNLVPGDTNGAIDIFLRDRVAGTTERVSVATDGTQANQYSELPSISAGGRFVAFNSVATNLVPGDTNGVPGDPLIGRDIFVHDRVTGETERVSVASDGSQHNLDSYAWPPCCLISGDGRYVTFQSLATNLVPGDSACCHDVFVHDRLTGETERVSVASDGTEGNGHSVAGAISRDGRYVAYESWATNLTEDTPPPEPGADQEMFVYDRLTKVTERVSIVEGENRLQVVSINSLRSGRYPLFTARRPGEGSPAERFGLFVRDRGPATGIGAVTAARSADSIEVSGWARFSGSVLAAATDPVDGPAAATPGTDLSEARVILRPEQEDLLVRLGLANLTGAGGKAGIPGVVYGISARIGGVPYEVRAFTAATTTTDSPAAPLFVLYRCEVSGCVEVAKLTGSIGTTGSEVLVAVPQAVLQLPEGARIEDLRAYTALGQEGSGPLVTIDELRLPDAAIPSPVVEIGLAAGGVAEEGVIFSTTATVFEGRFQAALDEAALGPEDRVLWARACLGSACGGASASLDP